MPERRGAPPTILAGVHSVTTNAFPNNMRAQDGLLTIGSLVDMKNRNLKRVMRSTHTRESLLVEHWSFDRVGYLAAMLTP